MATSYRRGMALLCLTAAALPVPAFAAETDQQITLPEMVVTGTREDEPRAETPSSVSVLGEQTIDQVKPTHPSEILDRVPGAVVQQTNGEGSVVGIRQPIGTNPLYLYLQDGVPIQAAGFFNHNALYLLDLPQAGGIEVIRGPGTALQGNDAIGGVINVLTRPPSGKAEASLTAEAGAFGWLRGLGSASDTWGDNGLRGDVNLTHTDGWRDRSAYDRQSVVLRGDRVLSADSSVKAVLNATNIDQQTGALSYLSAADYRNDPTRNDTPIAFRKVQNLFGSLAWEREGDDQSLSVTPYFRVNTMQLLPSWQLSYDPVVYRQSYYSLGAQGKLREDFAPWRTRLIAGLDLDYSPGSYHEDRIRTTSVGPVFASYTTLGATYDYDVTFWEAAPYLQAETSPLAKLRLTAGLRLDSLGYQYTNNLPDGAFVTPTPFGNRTFYRPASTDRFYAHPSPSLGATYAVTPALNGFVSYKQSFRIPENTQLFRQGSNLDSDHLQPITADTYEIGLRGPDAGESGGEGKGGLTWEVSVYRTEKRNDILTTNTGDGPQQTNNGKTRHTGIEAAVGWHPLAEWRLTAAGSYAHHEYVHWVASGIDYSGKTISSAPRLTGNVTLAYTPARLKGLSIEAEWQHLGAYWMDDANTQKYGGYDLANLRASYALTSHFEVFLRLINLFDTRWATAAQVSNGQAQYAPGMPLTTYGGITARF